MYTIALIYYVYFCLSFLQEDCSLASVQPIIIPALRKNLESIS